MPTSKRMVTYPRRAPRGGREVMWAYGIVEVADLLGLNPLSLRRSVAAGKTDVSTLEAVMALWMKRRTTGGS